jgi:Pyruvate/2-oxoacid:ferredoxin oxidoreductase delta subunit
MLDALRRLIESQSVAAGQPLPAAVFWQLAASDSCSACRLCANLCPTGAIQITLGSDDVYVLSFVSAACTGCGECVDVCASTALHQDDAPSAWALLALEPTILRSGRLYRCERCSTRFAAPEEARLCPLCTLRATRPFGAALPPGMQPRPSRPVRR